MATIRDVAREAGVSVTTVSHVFSGRRRVAEETGRRVREVAERLGYRPDAAARSLATGRSTTVGLYFQMSGEALLLNPLFSALLSGFSAEAAELGFTFMLLPESPEASPTGWKDLAGVVIVDPTPDNAWIPVLAREGVRVVTIGRYLGGIDLSWVDNEHRAGIADAVDHLVDQGYRNLVLLSVWERLSYIADIEQAFTEAVAGLDVEGRLVHADDFSDRAARRVTADLLSSPDPPDAVVAAIDHMAIGVLQAAEELGVAVPAELGVVGGSDTVLARHARPPLTSVRVFPEELAREALRLVNGFWHEAEAPDRQVLLPAKLVVRESTLRMGGARDA